MWVQTDLWMENWILTSYQSTLDKSKQFKMHIQKNYISAAFFLFQFYSLFKISSFVLYEAEQIILVEHNQCPGL